MIWFTLAMFVVSFILTALLTPKPEFEDARSSSLDDVNFPRATEDAPNPLVLGKVPINAPNTIWYGNFHSTPIKEKIKTGLFSSTRIVVGHKYYLTLDMALAMGPNTVLEEILIDNKTVWTGPSSATSATSFTIDKGSLFGGHKEGGGWKTQNTYYPGSLDLLTQPVDSVVEGHVGVGMVPAYLGSAHVVMEGYIGESASLKAMSFVVSNYSNDLNLPNEGKIGEDMNPAEAIYQIFTNKWRGMSIPQDMLEIDALREFGQTCYDESNGVSIKVTAETSGAKVIQEILRQVDGISYQDPETGKLIFKLIRKDYNVEDLEVFDEYDILKITNFAKTGWDEVVSQVKISFPQRDQNSKVVAISQDGATAGMLGRMKSTTISMPFCYDRSNANAIASRERSQLSVPLFNLTLEFNRGANRLRPGKTFIINWPDYGFSGLVMRVQEFDFGSLLEGRIVVQCLQDSFALNNVVFGSPPSSGWVAPETTPKLITTKLLIEMPNFYHRKLQYPPPLGYSSVLALAVRPSSASSSFDLALGVESGDNNLTTREPIYTEYAASGIVAVDYEKKEGFLLGHDSVTGLVVTTSDNFVPASSLSSMKTGEEGIIYVNGEWIGFLGVIDNLDGTSTLTDLYRGLLGSNPKRHVIGTRVWQVTPEYFGTGILDNLEDTGTVYWKVIDRVAASSMDLGEIPESVTVMNKLKNRPLRPRDLKVSGSRSVYVSTLSDLPLTVSPSDPSSAEISLENDSAETTSSEKYNVEVFIGGVYSLDLSKNDVSMPYTIPFSSVAITEPDCEINVYSKRNLDGVISAGYGYLPFSMDQLGSVAGPGAYRYWRVLWEGQGGDTASIADIQLRSTSGGDVDLTGSGIAISSSENGSYINDNAFDDSMSSLWAAAAADNFQWIGYDFGVGVSHEISKIIARARIGTYSNQAFSSAQFQYSEDGINWTTAFSSGTQTAWGSGDERTFTAAYA